MTVNVVKGLLAKAQQQKQPKAVQEHGSHHVAHNSSLVTTVKKGTEAAYNNVRATKVDRPTENRVRSYKEASELADNVAGSIVENIDNKAISAQGGLKGDSSFVLR